MASRIIIKKENKKMNTTVSKFYMKKWYLCFLHSKDMLGCILTS